MAAKVVLLPQKHSKDGSQIKQLVCKWLTNISSDQNLIDCVSERMMSFINNYATKMFEPTFNLPVPVNMSEDEASALLAAIEHGVENTAIQVEEMVNRIIVERFFFEVEFYKMQLKFGTHKQKGEIRLLNTDHI